jgi:hypothetical protein
MGEKCRILMAKPEGKSLFKRLRYKQENINYFLKKQMHRCGFNVSCSGQTSGEAL